MEQGSCWIYNNLLCVFPENHFLNNRYKAESKKFSNEITSNPV